MQSPLTARPKTRWLALLAVASCGGLDNDPLTTGVVRGQLSEVDSSALVAPVAAPAAELLTRRATLSADGSFELSALPAGSYTLFIVATADKVLEVQVAVRAGSISELGLLTPVPGAFIDARLSQPSLAASALVTVQGTPYVDQKFALASALLTIGPLPQGSFEFVAQASGTEQRWNSQLAEGERQTVTVSFAPTTGCVAAGRTCPSGLVCANDGSCVACLLSTDCAAGLTCEDQTCVGTFTACASCSSDDQCGTGNWCTALDDHRAICVAPCGSSGGCNSGFTCREGSCLPASDDACGHHDD